MAIGFLETTYKLNVSDLSIGTFVNNSISVPLTRDMRLGGMVSNLTVTLYDENNNLITSNPPYDVSIQTLLVNEKYALTFSFPYPFSQTKFGLRRKIRITDNNGSTFDIDVEVNYANKFVATNWNVNSDEIVGNIDDIDVRATLSSKSINNRLRSLLQNALTSLNVIRKFNDLSITIFPNV